MAMSSKHHKETAKILSRKRLLIPETAFKDMVTEFIIMFKKDNPRFVADEFKEACYEESK